MALKDWKKIGRDYWKYKKGISNDSTKSIKIYEEINKKFTRPYQVYVVGVPSYNSGIVGSFKTKSKALKYARAYMRKY